MKKIHYNFTPNYKKLFYLMATYIKERVGQECVRQLPGLPGIHGLVLLHISTAGDTFLFTLSGPFLCYLLEYITWLEWTPRCVFLFTPPHFHRREYFSVYPVWPTPILPRRIHHMGKMESRCVFPCTPRHFHHRSILFCLPCLTHSSATS